MAPWGNCCGTSTPPVPDCTQKVTIQNICGIPLSNAYVEFRHLNAGISGTVVGAGTTNISGIVNVPIFPANLSSGWLLTASRSLYNTTYVSGANRVCQAGNPSFQMRAAPGYVAMSCEEPIPTSAQFAVEITYTPYALNNNCATYTFEGTIGWTDGFLGNSVLRSGWYGCLSASNVFTAPCEGAVTGCTPGGSASVPFAIQACNNAYSYTMTDHFGTRIAVACNGRSSQCVFRGCDCSTRPLNAVVDFLNANCDPIFDSNTYDYFFDGQTTVVIAQI
jgi:hypothetical protein